MTVIGIDAGTRVLRLPVGSPYRLRLRAQAADGSALPLAGSAMALRLFRGATLLKNAPGSIDSDDIGDFALFVLDGTDTAALPASSSISWEIGDLFSDGKTPMLGGAVYVAPAAPAVAGDDENPASSAFDDATWSPAIDTLVVVLTGARGKDGGDPIDGIVGTLPGYFPSASFPTARVLGAAAGNNDLYTCPNGRKAIIVDFIVTNLTAGAITNFPQLKISGTYFRIGADDVEGSGGIGHNYGTSGVRSIPIVLNAGETFAVNCSDVGEAIWANIIEFDATSPLARADLRAWSAGNNILFTMPAGATISIGNVGLVSVNDPATDLTGFCYVNGSAGSRTLSGIYIVPASGAPSATNQFGGSNVIPSGNAFAKYFHGGLLAGDQIVIVMDSGAAGQFAWFNYVLR